jgi:hypothetical protein
MKLNLNSLLSTVALSLALTAGLLCETHAKGPRGEMFGHSEEDASGHGARQPVVGRALVSSDDESSGAETTDADSEFSMIQSVSAVDQRLRDAESARQVAEAENRALAAQLESLKLRQKIADMEAAEARRQAERQKQEAEERVLVEQQKAELERQKAAEAIRLQQEAEQQRVLAEQQTTAERQKALDAERLRQEAEDKARLEQAAKEETERQRIITEQESTKRLERTENARKAAEHKAAQAAAPIGRNAALGLAIGGKLGQKVTKTLDTHGRGLERAVRGVRDECKQQ